MKITNTITISDQEFKIDEDAWSTLQEYFYDIENRVAQYDIARVMKDVESQLAEHFRNSLKSNMQVIDVYTVRYVIKKIGTPETFGDTRNFTNNYNPEKRLYRTRYPKILGGVCGGVAKYFNLDVVLVRALTVGLVLFAGMSLWVYIIMWAVVPIQKLR